MLYLAAGRGAGGKLFILILVLLSRKKFFAELFSAVLFGKYVMRKWYGVLQIMFFNLTVVRCVFMM